MENKPKRILLTGAGGFVGQRFLAVNAEKYEIIPLSLRNADNIAAADLQGIDAIVHLAGKAHEMSPIPDNIYFEVNFDLTVKLAEKAMQQGVPHFLYISSTKVYGDVVKEPLNENSPCHPTDAYGKSKLMAEEWLGTHAAPKMNVAIIRPPLVYGPAVKGNMIKLLHLCASRWPLPFGKMQNLRSMVFIDNLLALFDEILHQQANGIFIGGDAKPLSTTTLIVGIREHMGKKPGLFQVPRSARALLQQWKPALYERLFGSFIVDNTSTNERLNFTPPFSTDQGILTMVKWFKTNNITR